MSTTFHGTATCPCHDAWPIRIRHCSGPWYRLLRTRFGWWVTIGHDVGVCEGGNWRRTLEGAHRAGQRWIAREQRRVQAEIVGDLAAAKYATRAHDGEA